MVAVTNPTVATPTDANPTVATPTDANPIFALLIVAIPIEAAVATIPPLKLPENVPAVKIPDTRTFVKVPNPIVAIPIDAPVPTNRFDVIVVLLIKSRVESYAESVFTPVTLLAVRIPRVALGEFKLVAVRKPTVAVPETRTLVAVKNPTVAALDTLMFVNVPNPIVATPTEANPIDAKLVTFKLVVVVKPETPKVPIVPMPLIFKSTPETVPPERLTAVVAVAAFPPILIF